jgi:hypothetical protein
LPALDEKLLVGPKVFNPGKRKPGLTGQRVNFELGNQLLSPVYEQFDAHSLR